MHICFLTHEYPKKGFPHGGIGSFVKTIAQNLVKSGHQVSVVGINYLPYHEKEIEDEVVIYRLKRRKIKGLVWYFNSKAINNKISAIHTQQPIDIVESSELGLAHINKITGIKFIIRLHGGHHFFALAENRPTEWKKAWSEKKSYAKADHIIAVSQYVANVSSQLLKIKDKNIGVIYNPIDTKRFYQADVSKIEKHTIFFAGSIVEKKGIRQLIQSLEYLTDDFPDIKLIVAGKFGNVPGTNKPYKPILEAAITDKLRPYISFLGVVPNFEIPIHIEKAQICCYPSHMEAMPLAWLEVLAMGKVFLGSNTGPGPEAVVDNVTGFLVNPHHPKEIADKIRYIFENYDAAIKMASKARERILDEFDVDVLVDENIKFYKSIV